MTSVPVKECEVDVLRKPLRKQDRKKQKKKVLSDGNIAKQNDFCVYDRK